MEEVPANTPAPTNTPAFDASAGKWHAGFDADTVGYITNRGLDKLDAAAAIKKTIEAHRNAEGKLGAPADRLLRIPTDPNDAEGWGKIHTALGKPPKADGYDFSAYKDADEGFLNFARDWAHKHNLSKADGEAFVKDVSEWANSVDQAEEQQKAADLQVEKTALKKDWGFNEKANLLTAQNAIRKLNVDPKAVAALEGQVGYSAVMKMFFDIGRAIHEDQFITSEHTGEVMTAGGAKEKIAQLKKDPEWVKRYNNGGTQSKEFKEMQDLLRLSMGQGASQ